MTPWGQIETDALVAMLAERIKPAEIARRLGRTTQEVYERTRERNLKRIERKQAAVAPTSEEWDIMGDSATYTATTKEPIRTEDDLYRVCKIDREVWEAERLKPGAWTTTVKRRVFDEEGRATDVTELVQNYKITANLKRRVAHLATLEKLALYKEMADSYSPTFPTIDRPPIAERKAAVIAAFDAHLNKLAWPEEVGGGAPYDLSIAIRVYEDMIDDLLARIARDGVEKIVFLIGQDFLNVDNQQNTTTRGTPQHSDTRIQKAYREAKLLLIRSIDKMLAIAPVTVISTPGNHDSLTSWTLCDSLQSWYRLCTDVTFNNDAVSRKYWRYGKNLICIAHGDEVKAKDLPLHIAVEHPEEWATAIYREIYTGHFHQRGLSEHQGVLVRICPSLSAIDAWHFNNGYTGNRRAAEVYIYRHAGALYDVHHYDVEPVRPAALVDAA